MNKFNLIVLTSSILLAIIFISLTVYISIKYETKCEKVKTDCYDEYNHKINELTCEKEMCKSEVPNYLTDLTVLSGILSFFLFLTFRIISERLL